MSRLITRRIPGYVWVQFCTGARPRFGHWSICNDIVHVYALGPFRVLTMPETRAALGADEAKGEGS